MSISVIIPNCNRTDEIKALLATLNKIQTLIGEIIIVDDASTANLGCFYNEMQEAYQGLSMTIVQRPTNGGPGVSRNVGISLAKHDTLLFIDSDVYCEPDCVRKLYEQIAPYDITFPTVMYPDGGQKSPHNIEFSRKHCMDSCIFMIKRNALQKMDTGFDEDIRIGEDFDFFLRAHIFGLQAMYVHNATAHHPRPSSCNAADLRSNLQYPLYARLKLMGMCKYHVPWIMTIGIHVTNHLLGALSGRRKGMFSTDTPVPYSENRWALIKAFCTAIMWNIRKFRSLSAKRKKLRNAIIQSGKSQ